MVTRAEVTMRPMSADDVDAVVALLAAAEARDRTDEHYDAADLREELADPATDPATDWLLAVVGDQVVAHQRLVPRAAEGGVQRIALDGAVHPDHRGRGIGSVLVGRLAERARAYAAERGVGPVLTASAPDDVADVGALLASQGLHPHRWTFAMQADLTGELLPAPTLPPGLSLHTWEGVAHEELRTAHNTAFVGHPGFAAWDVAMWEQWVSGARAHRPATSLLLRDEGGGVASYVECQEFVATQASTGRREAYVAKVGTLPRHRRRGLAGLLLRHAMRRCAAAGYAVATLDVDAENPTGANAVYEQAGFRVIRRWTNFESRD